MSEEIVPKDSLEKMKKELSDLISFPPQKIYGTLTTVSFSPEGELVLFISKKNQFKLVEIYKNLKALEGKEIYVFIAIGLWADKDNRLA